ncbi:MAG: 50S ribosomal protein L24 [Halobacteria archaeon]
MTEKTTQPRKQRKNLAEAPLHQRHNQVHSTLSDELREKHGTRRVRVAVGDDVEIMRGDFAGETGEVVEVDLDDYKVHVEDATVEKTDGEEVTRPIDPSNLRVVSLNFEDRRREERIGGDD